MKTRKAWLAAALTITSWYAHGADSLQTKLHRNEIGIVLPVYSDVGYNKPEVGLMGLQYKKWVRPNVGIRILAGYGLINMEEHATVRSYTDSFVESRVFTNADLFFAGAGLEAQKQFYRKIYFFAAVEFRAAYGKGQAFENIETHYTDKKDNITYSTLQVGRSNFDNTVLHLSISPTIGARLQLKRISAGLELYAIDLTYQKITNAIGKSNFMCFGTVGQRLSVSYKF